MFDKLKKLFQILFQILVKKKFLRKILKILYLISEIALLESDVAQEVIDDISATLKNKLLGLSVEKDKTPEELIQFHVQKSIYEILTKSGTLDLVKEINFKKENKGGPFVVVFLGINGTGKTTTVAKVANLLHKNGLSVVLAASDTHRAGAIEQLGEHARRLSLKMIHQRYGADSSAVARDAVEYGKKHRVDTILIDTAGRMQTAKNLMDEISKIVQVVKPDLKIFIGDSLAGNDAIYQAKEFFAYTKFDASILTKTDADAKGGAIISITYLTSKPIIYLGVGQNYNDIIPFDLDTFVESLFGSQISKEITNKYSSNIINESKNNEKLPEIKSKSISDNESIHSVKELHQNKPSSSNLDPIISNNLNNNDIAISKVEVKEEEKKVDYQKNNTINLENEPQFDKSEKITGTKEDSKTLLDKSYSSNNTNDDDDDSKKHFVTEKTAENKDQKKKGFFSSLFGKRKSQVDSNKVLSTDEQKNKQNNQEKSNSDKNEDNTTNKNEISEKNKNKDKNEVKYLSDDDLDELLKE